MNRSFQSVVIAFFASILLISGCSSGSSTGVSFSKEAVTEEQCFSEYVSFYGDLQDSFMDSEDIKFVNRFTPGTLDDFTTYDYDDWNDSFGAVGGLAAAYGKDHYHRTGAKEGRQLPYGCEAFLRPHPQCFDDYLDLQSDVVDFDFSQDHLDAIGEMNEIHGVIRVSSTTAPASGYHHWIKHGRDEGRAIPTNTHKSCKGMITHQAVCRVGSRFPNCDDSQDLGATGLGAALAEAAAAAQACALRGGALNTDTNQCTIPEEEEGDSCQNRSLGGLCLD